MRVSCYGSEKLLECILGFGMNKWKNGESSRSFLLQYGIGLHFLVSLQAV